MRKSFRNWGVLSLILGFSILLLSWDTTPPPVKKKYKVEEPELFFTDGTPNKGLVHRDQLAEAIQKPFIVKDKKGNEYPIVFFQYVFAHVSIYADETGKMMLYPDYSSAYAREGIIPDMHIKHFDFHASFGDTLIIENVQFLLPDSTLYDGYAKGMKIFIDDDEEDIED